jgi:hypothetical protein
MVLDDLPDPNGVFDVRQQKIVVAHFLLGVLCDDFARAADGLLNSAEDEAGRRLIIWTARTRRARRQIAPARLNCRGFRDAISW